MNQKVFRGLFAAGAVLLLAVIAPVIWAAVSAGVGLLALGVIGLVGMGVIQLIPFLGQKMENWVLSLRKAEARNNPIEQLQNYLMQKTRQVNEFKQAVAAIGAQITSLKDMVAQRKRERKDYDASAQERAIIAMTDAHQNLVGKYQAALTALDELRLAVEDREFQWKFKTAGDAALNSLNSASGKQIMDTLLADEAFTSVADNFNRVFAELEMESVKLTDAKQLKFDAGMTIDVSAINLTAKV